MPTLSQLLESTMLFTAARGRNLSPVPVQSSFKAPKPKPITEGIDEDTVLRNPVWHFEYDPGTPALFRNITIRSRGMGMNYSMPVPAFDLIRFSDIKVLRADDDELTLPLSSQYVVGTWWTHAGRVQGGSGLWRLPARVDTSLVVAFAYAYECGVLRPVLAEEVEVLGESFMPPGDLPSRSLEWIAGKDQSAWVCIGPSRYVVACELVLCKENNDFVPGGIVGMCRVHPHALVWSNEDCKRIEATIELHRPKHAMVHDSGDKMADEVMKNEHHLLLVADTNRPHMPFFQDVPVLKDLPLPYTDVLYDYYDVAPFVRLAGRIPIPLADPKDIRSGDHVLQKLGEVTLADSRFTRTRIIEDAVKRRSKLTRMDGDILKEPRQGQFDNVHIAPRMKLRFTGHEGRVELDEIVMINTCLHDCTHMHVRWSSFLKGPIVYGWKDGVPNSEPGAPMVPENQTVFASFPNPHSIRYRAVAEGVSQGQLQVFCHHGLAYAVDRWPSVAAQAGETVLLSEICQGLAAQFDEPWQGRMPTSWAAFYWRVRFTGDDKSFLERHPDKIVFVPRSTFDLETCMR